MEDKWETCKIMRPKHPQRTGDSQKQMRHKCQNNAAPQETGDSGAQVEDKGKTSVKSQWETSVKSCGHSNHSVAEKQ